MNETRWKKQIAQRMPNPRTNSRNSGSVKRCNLGITGREEGEETQFKGAGNIFNKTIEENFPNLKEVIA